MKLSLRSIPFLLIKAFILYFILVVPAKGKQSCMVWSLFYFMLFMSHVITRTFFVINENVKIKDIIYSGQGKMKAINIFQKLASIALLASFAAAVGAKKSDFSFDNKVALYCFSVAFMQSGFFLFAICFDRNPNAAYHSYIKGTSLVDTGVYSLVRHPMYLGKFFFLLGIVLLSSSFTTLALFFTWFITLMVLISIEENELSENMQGYNKYLSKVPYKLFIGIY